MLITSNFRKLYFSMLTDIYRQMTADKRIIMSFDKFRDNIKIIDENYPYYDGTIEKISLRDIRSKDLVLHVEFIVMWCGNYGITPTIIAEEWERMLQEAHA